MDSFGGFVSVEYRCVEEGAKWLPGWFGVPDPFDVEFGLPSYEQFIGKDLFHLVFLLVVGFAYHRGGLVVGALL